MVQTWRTGASARGYYEELKSNLVFKSFIIDLTKRDSLAPSLTMAGFEVNVLHDDGALAAIECKLNGYATILEVGPGTACEPGTFVVEVRSVLSMLHPKLSRILFTRIERVLYELGGHLET